MNLEMIGKSVNRKHSTWEAGTALWRQQHLTPAAAVASSRLLGNTTIKYGFERLIQSNLYKNRMLFILSCCNWSLQWAGLTVCRLKCKHWVWLSYVEANCSWQSLQHDKHCLSTVSQYLKVTTNILLKCKQPTSWRVKQHTANLSKIKKAKILFDTR